MSVSNTSGKTYDVSEFGKLNQFLKEQETEFKKIDESKEFQQKKIAQYTLILVGVVVSLYAFSIMINKKK